MHDLLGENNNNYSVLRQKKIEEKIVFYQETLNNNHSKISAYFENVPFGFGVLFQRLYLPVVSAK